MTMFLVFCPNDAFIIKMLTIKRTQTFETQLQVNIYTFLSFPHFKYDYPELGFSRPDVIATLLTHVYVLVAEPGT